MGLLSGLESLGLGTVAKEQKVFEEESREGEQGQKITQKPKVTEEELLFDKKFICPSCEHEFTSKMLRAGKVKLIGSDLDLRPMYEIIEPLKYDAVVCPKCGYGALNRFWTPLMDAQAKLISEQISNNFKGMPLLGDSYSFDEALLRYKMVLMSAIVKKAKASEKAYTCLKMGWLLRAKAESLAKDLDKRDALVEGLQKEEEECLKNAFEGFKAAFEKESFPMCGMDEVTVTYLVGELARRCGNFEESGRWISRVLTNKNANERIKNKAREIKELIVMEKKNAEKE